MTLLFSLLVEYLVLWKGFSKFDSSWEHEENITPECVRQFRRPRPAVAIIQIEVDLLRVAVERHLKSKCRLAVKVSLGFDVFRFLFRNKGISRDGWLFLMKGDFLPQYFPPGWVSWEDSHGQGIKVFYSIRMKIFLSWSPKKYLVGSDGSSVLCPRTFEENLSFNFTKVALQDSSE